METLLAISGVTDDHEEKLRDLGCYEHPRGFWVAPDRETLHKANRICEPRPQPHSDTGYWMKVWRSNRYLWDASRRGPGLMQQTGYGIR